ncbi:MAG: thioredoxin-disulfide reductase [Bacteroidales bacterium OttesenSCG-928-I14]|jgi:thioredoxin reductase (NADPH)|nr:thioredoxin-disulfide reductase [Bacteroidales bacterium OttesenSCG-928-I14]
MDIINNSFIQNKERIKCLIIGSGPAGYTSAIYTARANLAPILYEGSIPGGQLTTTSKIENFPGYPNGISGIEIIKNFKKQAQKFGADIRSGIVTDCDLSKNPYKIIISYNHTIETDTLIICTGSTPKYLGVPDEQKYAGKGISFCAVCDGFFYKKKIVAVIGGGDSACEEALYLSNLAKKIYLIVRKNYLRASKILQNKVTNNSKIEIFFNTHVIGFSGKEYVEEINLIKNKGETNEKKLNMVIDGVFLAIGHKPNSEIVKNYILVNTNGFIKTKQGTTRTNLPGIFAAGDVADQNYQQIITAAGAGCIAAIEAERYLKKNKNNI